MGKYSEIVINRSWVGMTLYPESIPHLLHYDMAYLWVLEKEKDLRPRTWEKQIEAWRYLVALLLTGELEIVKEDIKTPLLNYTNPYGITAVYWLRPRNTENKVVGVLSPTVLARPLPDFQLQDLDQWKTQLRDPKEHRPDELRHFVWLAIRSLRQGQDEGSFRSRLARILEREFEPQLMNRTPPPGVSYTIPILCQFRWTQEHLPCLENVDVLVLDVTERSQVGEIYVPRCEHCNFPLTKSENDSSVDVQGERFEVKCERGHSNTLDLSNFLIWIRDSKNQVVVWDRQGSLSIPKRGFPPEPEIKGNEVHFKWNPAQLGGERQKQFLKLQFPGKSVKRQRVDHIFFTKLLMLGDFDTSAGLPLPIRPEWLDAIENLDKVEDEVKIEVDNSTPRVTYRGIRLKGWPVDEDGRPEPISWTFGSLSLHREPDIALGIFPNPRFVPSQWRWYRVFLHGSKCKDYKIEMQSSNPILLYLLQTEGGYPENLTVLSNSRNDTGVTYRTKKSHSQLSAGSGEVYVGIDFGTINTIVYFSRDEQDPDPRRNGLNPSKLHTVVQWLAKAGNLEAAQEIGHFLPGPNYVRPDPYIIPSALWQFQNHSLIRWGSDPPVPDARPETGFKWDRQGVDHSALRKAYLQELLLLGLPLVLEKTGLTASEITVRIGFAFPLAFDYTARDRMKRLQRDLKSNLKELTGLTFEFYAINESRACVRAFGMPGYEDTFLVADMGGATMDLAFFTFRGGQEDPKMHQVGSIRFAGESYLEILVERKETDVDKQDALLWKLRDQIAQGQSRPDRDAEEILDRFNRLAFEFLRTMIAAYRHNVPERKMDKINLILVGNGWRLVEIFSEQKPSLGPRGVFLDYYKKHLLEQLGDRNLILYERGPLCDLPSSKHLVAIGVLKNARGPERRNELEGDLELSKLPAGRTLEFRTQRQNYRVEWHELIGEAVRLRFRADELRGVSFELNDMPPLEEPWHSCLLGAFRTEDIPYMDESSLRDQILLALRENPTKLIKGPLQIILEKGWIEWLKRKRR
jgi:hypothetical protein